jgi:SpoIID/LytB domain protein
MNESGWRNFRWQRSSSLGEMTKSLQKFLKLSGDQETKFKQIKQVKVTERALSGRVQALEVETDTGKIIVKKDEIIDAFDAPDSTLFYLKPEYELNPKNPKQPILKGYTFVGGGLGHGVGMSQTGSYRLAKEGWNYSRILNFYYTNTQLKTLRSEFWQ